MKNNRTIFTGLTKESWDAGLRWVRFVKQEGVTISVVDMGLEFEQVSKLQELSVVVLPNTKKTGVAQVDIFNSLVTQVQDGQFLFWDVEVQTTDHMAMWGLLFSAPLLKNFNVHTLVFPLTAIDSRVRMATSLENEVISKYNSVLFSGLMAGSLYDWKLFTGLYSTLVETAVVETMISARNLALNLFALYFPDRIDPKPVEYQISALQMP